MMHLLEVLSRFLLYYLVGMDSEEFRALPKK